MNSIRKTKGKAQIIVLSNSKGGCGKTTTAVHLLAALNEQGYSVGSIDMDFHQAALTKYLSNRWTYLTNKGVKVPTIDHRLIDDLSLINGNYDKIVRSMMVKHDYVIIDTPANDTEIIERTIIYADVLITPINDSLIDLEMIVRLNPRTLEVADIGNYAKLITNQIHKRKMNKQTIPRWFIMPSRKTTIEDSNNKLIKKVLNAAQEPLSYTALNGLTERIIYKELFLLGLTLFDLYTQTDTIDNEHSVAFKEIAMILQMIQPPEEKTNKFWSFLKKASNLINY